ncbi:MAG TPA: hypothetical protein VGM34_02895 [Chlamydiales bacterium]|jgi:hypothetical protein
MIAAVERFAREAYKSVKENAPFIASRAAGGYAFAKFSFSLLAVNPLTGVAVSAVDAIVFVVAKRYFDSTPWTNLGANLFGMNAASCAFALLQPYSSVVAICAIAGSRMTGLMYYYVWNDVLSPHVYRTLEPSSERS